MDEFIRESPIAFWSGVLALLLLVVVVWARPWRWPAALRAVSASTTREIARARGIRVEDFERVVPFLERKIRFERDEVTRYSIARASGATPPRWSFVLRTKRLGAQYPHGWVFRADSAPSPALDEILRTIAGKEFEDFLEFEADEAEVHAFWYEGGGAEDVDRVENYLRPLAAIGREASASGVGQDVPGPQP